MKFLPHKMDKILQVRDTQLTIFVRKKKNMNYTNSLLNKLSNRFPIFPET